MKKAVVTSLMIAAISPEAAFAQMDDLRFMTEFQALVKLLAVQEPCQIAVNEAALATFTTRRFQGREDDLLSSMSIQVRGNMVMFEEASSAEKSVTCAVARKYATSNKLIIEK